MPAHPKEETATGSKLLQYHQEMIKHHIDHAPAGITDQVAKESGDSTASSHAIHQEDTNATSGGAATFDHHKANPGPVIADNLGEPASKEELKKRSDELNKK